MSSPAASASPSSLELTTATASVSQEMRGNSSDWKTSWEASTEASRETSTSQSWSWETPRQDSMGKTWRKIHVLQGEKSLQSREGRSPEVTSEVWNGTKSRHMETMMRNKTSRPTSSSTSLSPVPRLVSPRLHSLTFSLLVFRLRGSFIFLVFIQDLLVLQSHLRQQSFGFLDGGVLTSRLLLVVIHRPAPASKGSSPPSRSLSHPSPTTTRGSTSYSTNSSVKAGTPPTSTTVGVWRTKHQ